APVALISRADIAVVRARRACRLHDVCRTGRARPGTGLGEIAFVDRRTAGAAGVARGVHARRGAGGAVALVGRAHVAIVRAGGARRLDRVGRTRRARARTGLGEVALVGCQPTRRARVARRVLTRGARAVAEVRGAGIAVIGARGAVRLERARRRAAR